MTFAVDGGIEWEKKRISLSVVKLTIRPSTTPESGYISGQMKDYTSGNPAPWDTITELGWILTLESGITNIGNYAFYQCFGFNGSLIIPGSVTRIGDNAFNICNFDGNLTIPDSVTLIGSDAFKCCPNFTDIEFLGNQPTMGSNAFNLKTTSPEKTYNVYSNGWANKNTFPEYDYTKWDFGSNVYVKVGSEWKQGVPYVRTPDGWKAGGGGIRVHGRKLEELICINAPSMGVC